MAVRVADSLKQQNDLKSFPVAYSEDIWIDKNKGEGEKDYADLQELYNEGALGGSGLPTPESKDKLLLSVENEETSELEWSQVDKSTVGDSPFKGTHDEWDVLTDEQKAMFETVIFTDDYGEGVIDDEKTSTDSTWSSKKINDSLVDLESKIDGVYTTEEKVVGKWIDGKPIYRKCGFKASLPANTATVLDTELKTTYVGTVIGYGGSVKSGDGEIFPFAGYVATSGERVTLIVGNDGLKMLKSSASYTNANWWLEYTKTTD